MVEERTGSSHADNLPLQIYFFEKKGNYKSVDLRLKESGESL